MSSAQSLVKKLYDIADIPLHNEESNDSDGADWIPMFAELLLDAIDVLED